MSFDMEQFLETFYEESFEGVDIMETALLELDVGSADSETVNTIFRAAHSIKGGGATFGLTDIAEFAHGLETLLDEMRDGRREVTQEAISLLLRAVDCMRDMLTAAKTKSDFNEEEVATVDQAVKVMLGSNENSGEADFTVITTSSVDVQPEQERAQVWSISFKPFSNLFHTGNDPVRMFRELERLGSLVVDVDISGLPAFVDLVPEDAYISWEITLQGDVKREDIEEVFSWVEDECDLSITQIDDPDVVVEKETKKELQPPATIATKPSEIQVVPAPEEKRKEGDRRVVSERRQTTKTAKESASIRVGIDKVDALINMVGELVITQSMLNQLSKDFDMSRLAKLQEGVALLERNSRELQENVMRIRMLPISFAFNRFPRMVHDLSEKLNKKIELKLSGEQTELDKTVMEKIGDPLVHLVRNSLDHGLETPDVRKQAGKSETGTLRLNAFHQGGNIVIEIHDDGAGLNKERILNKAKEKGIVGVDEVLSDEKIHELIFRPGFSTAEVVSDVSGRGVGMDVVKRNIKDLSGTIEVVSEEGVGSTFTIRLPLTLAILDGQLVKVGAETYIIPLVSIVESLQMKKEHISIITGQSEVYKMREDYLPIIRLHGLFDHEKDESTLDNGLLVVVEAEGQRVGLVVDDLLGQQQVVIKSLESNYRKVEGVSGATILGDGSVSLILDISGLIVCAKRMNVEQNQYNDNSNYSTSAQT
ncbi:Signal transduction histidine kinase CheA [hydrothermal vent metagenome]|uniref:Chemotaxis protein CheA n=1 Tax=hydrothermal vent metagenome TaxID=652676 RepID=A0A3B0Z9E3_9ZZZZ